MVKNRLKNEELDLLRIFRILLLCIPNRELNNYYKMRHKFILFCNFVCMLLFASCSNDDAGSVVDPNGSGTISLNVAADADFKTSRAVNESDYENLSNYTVQIQKDGKTINEWAYDEVPEFVDLANGSYQLKAFYGKDVPASTVGMYVEGTNKFDVNSDTKQIEVTCTPVCARVKVVFSSDMSKYFSDYKVKFTTNALKEETGSPFTWEKGDSDPVYLKVNKAEAVQATINLMSLAGAVSNVNKTYTLSPKDSFTLNVKPVVKSGNIGIEITIDETTNDIPVDIVIPSEWK